MSSVVDLPTPIKKINQEVIDLLHEWYEDALKGKISALALVACNSHGGITTAASRSLQLAQLVGGLHLLSYRLLRTSTE